MYQSESIDPQAPVAGPMIATVDRSDDGGGATSILPGFLAALARAMQAAAERERDRIAEVVTREAAEHVEKARTRAAAEAAELSRLAEADVARIKDWSKSEIDRIRRDADRRTNERRESLEGFLAKHESIIATEIGGVDVAIRGYRAELDRFFEELTGSTDPADIVRRADSLPTPPDLDAVRAAARAGAVAELANAPDPASVEVPPADADAGAEPSPEIDAASPETGAGLGVMDPDAVGRSDEMPAVLGEGDGEAAPTSATSPPADALHVEADGGVEVAVEESADHSSVAVRLLRSIALWTTQAEDDAPAKGAQSR
jgi:hypothetical protein